MGAAIGQSINSPKEWGQGWGAYGMRAASGYASTLTSNTITFGGAVLCDVEAVLRVDMTKIALLPT